MKKLTKISWMITLALGVIVFSCKEDDTVTPSIGSIVKKISFTDVVRTKKQDKSITITMRGLTADVAVTIDGKGFSVDKKTISSKKSQESLKISYLADLNTPKGTHKGTLSLKSGSAKLAIPLEAVIITPRDVYIRSNLNSNEYMFENVERNVTRDKEITITNKGILEDITISVEGKGYTVDKTTIPFKNKENKITISFLADESFVKGTHEGKLMLRSGKTILEITVKAIIDKPREVFIKSNLNSDYFSFGNIKRNVKKTKEITITTKNLTEDVKIKIEGEGYYVDKTSIPASKTEEKITIEFLAQTNFRGGAYAGTLTLSSGKITHKITLNAIVNQVINGYFVVNEGAFGGGNTSISYFDKTTNKMSNGIFKTTNKRPLGDQAQSMTIIDGKGYIVVQNSDKIEVINATNFSSVATIKNLPSPRYIIKAATDKAYISDWGADGKTGTIQVLNLKTNKVTGTIKTGKGPNEMVLVGSKVYVANSGGWATDKTVQVIDTKTDKILKTITVGDNPKSIVADKNGVVWVASAGISWPKNKLAAGSITKIVNDAVSVSYTMPLKGKGPTDIEINTTGTALYYNYNGKLYTSLTNEFVKGKKPTMKVLVGKKFYGIDLDPSTDHVLGFEAPNFTSSGKMYRYNSTGGLIDSYTVGIGPNGAGM